MALINCHECNGKVSTEADACPHCGAKPTNTKAEPAQTAVPQKKKPSAIVRYGGGFIAVIFILAFIGSLNNTHSPAAPTVPNAPAKTVESVCAKDDLQCLGDKAAFVAGIYCVKPIERLAKHSVRWTDGALELKFSHFRWANKEAGQLTMIGDKAEFQNGFGAFTPVVYECDLAPDNKTVLDVRVREGRL